MFTRSLALKKDLPALVQTRAISKVVASYTNVDKGPTSFDQKGLPLQPVNPFNLPPKANNAAGIFN
jgi:hypothetical protein